MKKKKEKLDLDFDRRTVPAIVVFVFLMLLGIGLFIFWKIDRNETKEEYQVSITSSIQPIYKIASSIAGDAENLEIQSLLLEDEELSEEVFLSKRSSVDSDYLIIVGAGFDDVLDGENSESTRILRLDNDLNQLKENTSYEGRCTDDGGTWLNTHFECEGVSRGSCSSLGGQFDECLSPCRHNSEEICIQRCVEVCTVSNPIKDIDIQKGEAYWISLETEKIIAERLYMIMIAELPAYQEYLYENLTTYLEQVDTQIEERDLKYSETEKVFVLSSSISPFFDGTGVKIDTSLEKILEGNLNKEEFSQVESIIKKNKIEKVYQEESLYNKDLEKFFVDRWVNIEYISIR